MRNHKKSLEHASDVGGSPVNSVRDGVRTANEYFVLDAETCILIVAKSLMPKLISTDTGTVGQNYVVNIYRMR